MSAPRFNVWKDAGASVTVTDADKANLIAMGASAHVVFSDEAPGHISRMQGPDLARAEDEMRDRIVADNVAFVGMAAAYEARLQQARQ